MHLASAAGIPTLGLFGPSRAENYAPWGENGAVVRTAIAYDDLFAPGYDHRNTDSLMDSLTLDAVVEAAQSLWRRGEARTQAQPGVAKA
jgi:ADP-heptose:LPS heptosyltransferase